MIPLLDVNVLVALAWPNHVHHGAASSWFRSVHDAGWATCPLTESGFVRVSSNVRAIPMARSVPEAVGLLRALRGVGTHTFWMDDTSLTALSEPDLGRIVGYRQVTDAHLLALATRNGGRLATFDRSVTNLTDTSDRVELLRR